MTGRTHHGEGDEGLLTLLRDALESGGDVPQHVKRAAYEAFAWRTIDAELAALAEDAGAEAIESGATRATLADVTAVTLSSPSVTLELQVLPQVVLGQMVPAGPAALQLQRLEGDAREVPVDELGCFTLEPAPGGLFRLLLLGVPTVATTWISLP